MRAVKYFIYDYEQSTGQRLVGLRRHVNSYIQGGGNTPSAPKPTKKEINDIETIRQQLESAKNDEIFMKVLKQTFGIPDNLSDIDDMISYLTRHPPSKTKYNERVDAFAQHFNNQQRQKSSMDEREEIDDEVSSLSEGHSTPLPYSNDEEVSFDDDEDNIENQSLARGMTNDKDPEIEEIFQQSIPEITLNKRQIKKLKVIAFFYVMAIFRKKYQIQQKEALLKEIEKQQQQQQALLKEITKQQQRKAALVQKIKQQQQLQKMKYEIQKQREALFKEVEQQHRRKMVVLQDIQNLKKTLPQQLESLRNVVVERMNEILDGLLTYETGIRILARLVQMARKKQE